MLGFPERDDDNTPQGKLAQGCCVVIWFVAASFVLIVVVNLIVYSGCYIAESDCKW